jgi:hypothetical protein
MRSISLIMFLLGDPVGRSKSSSAKSYVVINVSLPTEKLLHVIHTNEARVTLCCFHPNKNHSVLLTHTFDLFLNRI